MQSRQALDAPHKYTLQAFNMVYGVHCWPRVATWFAPHVFSVWWLRKRMLEDVPPMTDIEFLDTRADVRRPPLVLDAAWHFTSTGAPRELQRKLTTWGHARGKPDGDEGLKAARSAPDARAVGSISWAAMFGAY